jgi:integrase
LADLTVEHISAWRDERLAAVKPGSFLRDLALLRAVLKSAVDDWRWIRSNPSTGVKLPSRPQARQRLISPDEVEKIVEVCGDSVPTSRQVSAAFRLSLESAMRAGEILALTWANVFADYCRLPMTKNGFARDVPLSKAARAVIEEMRGNDEVKVFTISSAVLDATFRKLRKRAELDGFTFHDARATAITRLSRKVDILTLARISGHRDLKQLQVYYRESASDIAARL